MSVTVSITPALVAGFIYALVGFGLLCAGLLERSSFVNPRYQEVVLIAVIWPVWILQWPYYWVRGEYLVNDLKKLK